MLFVVSVTIETIVWDWFLATSINGWLKFSEDEIHTKSEKIQKHTDEIISEIDQRLSKKTEDLTNFIFPGFNSRLQFYFIHIPLFIMGKNCPNFLFNFQ